MELTRMLPWLHNLILQPKLCQACGSGFVPKTLATKFCHSKDCDKQQHEKWLLLRRARTKEANPDGKWHYEIKSCGKAHPFCSICRPELLAEMTEKQHDERSERVSGENNPLYGRRSEGFTGHQHTDEAKAKHAETARNRVWTDEAKERLKEALRTPEHLARVSENSKRHAEKDLPNCRCTVHSHNYPHKDTYIELTLRNILLKDFPEVLPSYRFGRYEVDAYVPSHRLAFEADGEHWHSSEVQIASDKKRDCEILERFGVVVVRLSGKELHAIDKASRRLAA